MTDADLARWAAAALAGVTQNEWYDECSPEDALQLIAEVRRLRAGGLPAGLLAEARRLRGVLSEISRYHGCGDACAAYLVDLARVALGDDGPPPTVAIGGTPYRTPDTLAALRDAITEEPPHD